MTEEQNNFAEILEQSEEFGQVAERLILSGNYTLTYDESDHTMFKYFKDNTDGYVNKTLPSYDTLWMRYYLNVLAWRDRNRITVETIKDALSGKSSLVITDAYTCIKCRDCGIPINVSFIVKNNHLFMELLADTPCEHNGNYEVEVEFPSGEVIIDDWPYMFHELLDAGLLYDSTDPESDLTFAKGLRLTTEIYAKNNILHFFVGNTCPSVWVEDDTLYWGNLHEDDRDKQIASVTTDLWWVTMIDVVDYKRFLKKLGVEYTPEIEKNLKTINIKPGKYSMRPLYAMHQPDSPDPDDYRSTQPYLIGRCKGYHLTSS